MNKKRLVVLLTVIALMFLLSGCTAPVDADGNVLLISLETSFSEMMHEGVFGAVLTYPLAQAINYLSQYVGVGMGITIVAIALNAVVLLFTFKSNVSMQRMQAMQPELMKIQKKYEGRTDNASRQRQAMEMNALYKKYDVNPMGSLLASFIQLPVLIAMYTAVRRSYAVKYGTIFGYSLDLTPVQAITKGAVVLVVIYVLMIVFQFISVSIPTALQARRAKAEADRQHRTYHKPEQPNVMMTYGMVVFIAFIMLSWPVALSLYYLIYSVINVVKTIAIDKMTHKE